MKLDLLIGSRMILPPWLLLGNTIGSLSMGNNKNTYKVSPRSSRPHLRTQSRISHKRFVSHSFRVKYNRCLIFRHLWFPLERRISSSFRTPWYITCCNSLFKNILNRSKRHWSCRTIPINICFTRFPYPGVLLEHTVINNNNSFFSLLYNLEEKLKEIDLLVKNGN